MKKNKLLGRGRTSGILISEIGSPVKKVLQQNTEAVDIHRAALVKDIGEILDLPIIAERLNYTALIFLYIQQTVNLSTYPRV